jgi:hypothetical protein
MTTNTQPKDDPLNVEIVGGKLVISIGIDCLAHAIEWSPSLGDYDHVANDYVYPKVTDPERFAREIAIILDREESEDGTTAVHRMLDRAAEVAIENGAEGVWCPGDVPE